MKNSLLGDCERDGFLTCVIEKPVLWTVCLRIPFLNFSFLILNYADYPSFG